MAETLRFHIPLLGIVSATLHNESAQIYQWLRETGEVDRLKRLDHLGAVRLAWEGAHHPRWEYIAFVLALIDRCKDCLPELHLGSKVKLSSSTEISSGSELLKCWTLLLNVGHLEWTFFSERALLFELWSRNSKQRKGLLVYFSNDRELESWARKILERGDIYRFFHILAFFRLDALQQGAKLDAPWRDILRAYVLDETPSPRLSRLRKLYGRLRQVAYMTLDPHYTPATLRLDATQLFSDPSALGDLLVREYSAGRDALMAVERYLYENVYLAEPVIRSMAVTEPELRNKIRESLHKDGLDKTIEALAKGELQQQIKSRELDTIVRLPVSVEPQFAGILISCPNPRKEQQRLELQLRRDARCRSLVSFWPSADRSSWVVQFHARLEDPAACLTAYRLAFDYVVQLRERAKEWGWVEWLGEKGLQDLLFERLACELVVRGLDLLAGVAKRLRWEWVPSAGGAIAVFGTRKNAREILKDSLRETQLDAERAELQGKLYLLRRRPGDWVAMSVGRLEAYEGKQRVCELDGCMIEVEGKVVRVTIIEVKSGVKSRAACRELKKKLREVFGRNFEVKHKREKKLVIAWASFDLVWETRG